MVVVMALIVILPITMAAYALLSHADDMITWVRNIHTLRLPEAPDWVAKLPLIGDKAAAEWNALSRDSQGILAARLQPYARSIVSEIIATVQNTGLLFVHLLLTVVLVGIFYASGEKMAHALILFARRIAGDRGESSVILAGQSIKAVALGIIVTALTQSILGGFGLWMANIPFAGTLTAVMFMFCIAQLGPFLPMLAGVVWLYMHHNNTAGTILLVWTLAVGLLDNFLRPILIKLLKLHH